MLYGNITFDEAAQAYTVFHSSSDGWHVTTTIKVQRHLDGVYKNYTIAYFVFEKVAQCAQYPPNNNVTFYNISIEWEGSRLQPQWSSAFVEDACNNRGTHAHIAPHTQPTHTLSHTPPSPPHIPQPTSSTTQPCKSRGRRQRRRSGPPFHDSLSKIAQCACVGHAYSRLCTHASHACIQTCGTHMHTQTHALHTLACAHAGARAVVCVRHTLVTHHVTLHRVITV